MDRVARYKVTAQPWYVHQKPEAALVVASEADGLRWLSSVNAPRLILRHQVT